MPVTLEVMKVNSNLVPCTYFDQEVLDNFKQNQGLRVELIRTNDRSIQHHRLYFGGLIQLLSVHWECDDGLISRYDRKVMKNLIDWIKMQGKNTNAISSLIDLYLQDRAEIIRANIPEYEGAGSKLNTIHAWLKEESGYYNAVLTPTGIRKELKSISFNSMSQPEFNEFYKKAFSVAWRFVLSKNFDNQEEAENIALQMSSMG